MNKDSFPEIKSGFNSLIYKKMGNLGKDKEFTKIGCPGIITRIIATLRAVSNEA